MTVRRIILYREEPEILRAKSNTVGKVDRRTRRLIQDLKDTLCDHPEGIGLAAPQINIHRRVVVVRLGGGEGLEAEAGSPVALVDPAILETSGARLDFDGCLSFPGLYAETARPHLLKVMGLDEAGDPFERVFRGFDAVLVHHEIDHLEGILFIDRVQSIKDLYTIVEDEFGRQVPKPLAEPFRQAADPLHCRGGAPRPHSAAKNGPDLCGNKIHRRGGRLHWGQHTDGGRRERRSGVEMTEPSDLDAQIGTGQPRR